MNNGLENEPMVMEDLDRYSYNPSNAGLQILLMLETGVRIGEACELKWSDVEEFQRKKSR